MIWGVTLFFALVKTVSYVICNLSATYPDRVRYLRRLLRASILLLHFVVFFECSFVPEETYVTWHELTWHELTWHELTWHESTFFECFCFYLAIRSRIFFRVLLALPHTRLHICSHIFSLAHMISRSLFCFCYPPSYTLTHLLTHLLAFPRCLHDF